MRGRTTIAVVLITLVVLGAAAAALFLTPNATFSKTRESSSTESITETNPVPGAPSGYGLDCNGFSPVYPNSPVPIKCSDPPSGGNGWGGRFYDNGHYIGHDEPSIEFFSDTPGSGYNVEWAITLPSADHAPTQNGSVVATFELYGVWFSMALCDPWSYPQNPCTPDSDSNVGGPYPASPNAAGAADLEIHLFPPYSGTCGSQSGLWCASMGITSLEETWNYGRINTNCSQPSNYAYIQTDGIPTGPPGPGQQNSSTYAPNTKTLFMNPGDRLLVTIKDTEAGLYIGIKDLTIAKSGYMVASVTNGFRHTNINNCSTEPFAFHPEFNTAKPTSVGSWSLGNINFAAEIGHWELGARGDNDSDESYCAQVWTVSGCFDDDGGGVPLDTDFDGVSYTPSWPDGSPRHPAPFSIGSPTDSGVGPMSYVNGSGYVAPYSNILFVSEVNDANPGCTLATGAGCTMPPDGAAFYPFYSTAGTGASCVINFGSDIPGVTTNDFGKDRQYGTENYGTFKSAVIPNPCMPLSTTTSTTTSATTSSAATASSTTSSATSTSSTTSAITSTTTTIVASIASTTASSSTSQSSGTVSSSPATSTASIVSSTTNSTTSILTSTGGATTTSGSGGVPEFPYQLGAPAVLSVLLAAFYLYVKRRRNVVPGTSN